MDTLKFIKWKTWFTNAFSAIVGLAALAMLIINPIMNLDSNLEALWSGLLVSSVAFYRSENTTLIKAVVAKFAKDNRLNLHDIYKEEGEHFNDEQN